MNYNTPAITYTIVLHYLTLLYFELVRCDCTKYPNCNVDNPKYIGDVGVYNGGAYNTEECGWDNGISRPGY